MEIAVGAIFVMLFTMVPYWFYLIYRLDKHTKAHHPDLHRDMGIGGLLPGSASETVHFDNSGSVLELCRFLYRRGDLALCDIELSRIVTRMRWFAVVFPGAIVCLIAGLLLVDGLS